MTGTSSFLITTTLTNIYNSIEGLFSYKRPLLIVRMHGVKPYLIPVLTNKNV